MKLSAVHELALMESLVETVSQHIGGERVVTVRVEVGALAAVVPDALRFCFDVCARGTCLEGAALEIAEIPGRARCGGCGAEVAIDRLGESCRACGGFDLDIESGQELRLRNLEVI